MWSAVGRANWRTLAPSRRNPLDAAPIRSCRGSGQATECRATFKEPRVPPSSPSTIERLKPTAKWLLRIAIALLVAWGVYRAAMQARTEILQRRGRLSEEIEQLTERLDRPQSADANETAERERLRDLLAEKQRRLSISPWSVRPGWLLLSGALYLLGLAPNAFFWRRVMRSMGADPGWRETLTAYFVGHLGKYVPGKALVVVLRTSLVQSERTGAAVAALAVFVETLTMMAVGGAVASLVLVFAFQDRLMLVLAAALVLAAGLPTAPPIFRRLVRLLRVRAADPNIERALEGLDWRLMASGWPLITIGWVLLGLSLWTTLMALPIAEVQWASSLGQLPLLTACVALAMVLGFVSLLPGGAGVREWVVMTLLAPIPGVGPFVAFSAAIWLRIIWLMSEIAISIILYGTAPKRAESAESEVA